VRWTLLSERVGGAELVVALPDDGGALDVSRLVRGWRGFFLQASPPPSEFGTCKKVKARFWPWLSGTPLELSRLVCGGGVASLCFFCFFFFVVDHLLRGWRLMKKNKKQCGGGVASFCRRGLLL